MAVTVPNLAGLGRTDAEGRLDALHLRHVARFPFAAGADGSATQQSPAAGAIVPEYSVVAVSYPSPMGPMPDSPVEGPALPAGPYEGQIVSVTVGNPWGSGEGAWVEFHTTANGGPFNFSGTLYFDHAVDASTPPRTEWMRRGALLGLAQRAYASALPVRLVLAQDAQVQSIEVYKA